MINNDLTETFDVSPIESQELDLYKPDQVTDEEKLSADLDYARDNLYEVIESSKEVLKDLISLAKQAQNPKVFEALSKMVKSISDTNKDLVELQKIKKDLSTSSTGPTHVTNNNLFVGSTAELLALATNRAKQEALELKAEVVVENE